MYFLKTNLLLIFSLNHFWTLKSFSFMYSNLCRHIHAFLSLIILLLSLHLVISILFQMEGTTNNRSMACVGRKMWLGLGLKVGCISCFNSRCLFAANMLQELTLDITYGTIFPSVIRLLTGLRR